MLKTGVVQVATPVFLDLPIFSPVEGFFVSVDKLYIQAKKMA